MMKMGLVWRWLVVGLLVSQGFAVYGGVVAKNLAVNPSFEGPCAETNGGFPNAWAFYTTGTHGMEVDTSMFRSGSCSLKVIPQDVVPGHMGLIQHAEVTAGRTYRFEAYVCNGRGQPLRGPFEGWLNIEWIGTDGQEISRSKSRRWGERLSVLRWSHFSVVGEAPEGAIGARFVICAYEGDELSRGSCYIDDVAILEE